MEGEAKENDLRLQVKNFLIWLWVSDMIFHIISSIK